MLVLSRKSQESVVVAGTDGHSCLVKITIVEIRGERVLLGFDAKLEVPVHRWEVWQRMAEQRDRANDGALNSGHVRPVNEAEPTHQRRLCRGDLVRISEGAFAGVEGTVAACQACRVIMSVDLIQPGVTIEIDGHLLELINEPNDVTLPGELIG